MFIGDSITAGYGVNGEQSDTVFTTKTEDVTKSKSLPVSNNSGIKISVSGNSVSGGIHLEIIPPPLQQTYHGSADTSFAIR